MQFTNILAYNFISNHYFLSEKEDSYNIQYLSLQLFSRIDRFRNEYKYRVMKKIKVLVLGRKFLYAVAAAVAAFVLAFTSLLSASSPADHFEDPKSGIIVIDPGHGGVDGGANTDGVLEKDINLAIAQKLKSLLEREEYKVVMTRERDIALDYLCDMDTSRHQKDLNARADIIGSCNAQMFVSIHVNCNFSRPKTDGSIVFYGERFQQNKILAYDVQRELNNIPINGGQRTVHDPQKGEYFLLKHSQVPGVIVETGFLSNQEERGLLQTEGFQQQLAAAIGEGIEKYLKESGGRQVEHTVPG